MPAVHRFSAPLWAMPGEGGWVFVTLPLDVSASIRAVPREPRPGFGSLRVQVTLGASSWKTSIFPEARTRCYVLPVKKAVRAARGIEVPDTVEVSVELLE